MARDPITQRRDSLSMLLDGEYDECMPDRVRTTPTPVKIMRESFGKKALGKARRIKHKSNEVRKNGWPDRVEENLDLPRRMQIRKDCYWCCRCKSQRHKKEDAQMSVRRIVEPLEKWERIARHASQETAHEKHIANVGVALKAIVHDRAHGSTDEPSDSNIINSSTEVHSLRMRTTRHGMPDDATK